MKKNKLLTKRQFVEATLRAVEENPRYHQVRPMLDGKPITLANLSSLEDSDFDRIVFLNARLRSRG